jgi:hypothetical protein
MLRDWQEGKTGTIDLKEEKERPVKSMIEYLYTTEFVLDGLEKIKYPSLHECDHDEYLHSFDNGTCFLEPYGLMVDLYTLGDKYDIPGLRAKACAHIGKLFASNPFEEWHHDIAVWEYAYQHSRKTDELRALLVDKIARDFLKFSLGTEQQFCEFVDRCHEVTEALLKAASEEIDTLRD